MQSRVAKSMKNTIFGMVGLLCSLIVSFIARSIFIRILGVEYNGVNGLFSNILQVLSLADLGFATSIAYALYKPLKEGDEDIGNKLSLFVFIMHQFVIYCVGFIFRRFADQIYNSIFYQWVSPIIVVLLTIIAALIYYEISKAVTKFLKRKNINV